MYIILFSSLDQGFRTDGGVVVDTHRVCDLGVLRSKGGKTAERRDELCDE